MINKRRDFIKKGLSGTAGIVIGGMGFSSSSYGSIIGANERLNIAVVGIRAKGKTHIKSFCNLRNVRVKCLCDVDEQFFSENIKTVEGLTGITPGTEWDMRRIFDDKDIHAVSFATPNHWHALGTIWACQAGKHVYVEKPASHNIFEGRKMIEAARKYNVRVQVGFQRRSSQSVREAITLIQDGGIGEVYMARGLCYKKRDSFGIAKNSNPPSTFHYDMWLGPAAYQPYNEKKTHYNHHWHWNTGNGDVGNQGPHQFDIARWGLNAYHHPVEVFSSGGIFGWNPNDCTQETPDTQITSFKYAGDKILQFEVRGQATNGEGKSELKIGNIFYGTEGHLELCGSTNWKAYKKNENEPFAQSKEIDGKWGLRHYANFIDAIRNGDDKNLTCDIREGFYSSALPLLANISYRLNRRLSFLGEFEKFVNDQEADMMLTRKYRKPYEVPKII